MTTTTEGTGAPSTGFFGHPRGLSTLFFTEMWERFSYYGMRSILMLFMTATVASGGLGLDPEQSGPIYAMYTSLVYLVAVPGGWLADNFLGQRRSVFYGGIIIMLGHIALAMHGLPFFFCGLGLVVIGTGLLKPNISVIVGQLYTKNDTRRDAGFSIFYMGINLGAFLSPLVCATLLSQSDYFKAKLDAWGMDPNDCWHWGFGAAAVGMFFGLLQYLWSGRNLGSAGLQPVQHSDPAVALRNVRTLKIGLAAVGAVIAGVVTVAIAAPELLTTSNIDTAYAIMLFSIVAGFFLKLFAGDWNKAERARLWTIFVLFWGAAIFWGVFEQAGSTLTLFAERSTRNEILGIKFGSGTWQSLNAVLIVLMAPFFAWLWKSRADKGNDLSYPTKFAIGLLFAGLGFAVLVPGAMNSAGGVLVSPLWLFAVYLLHTTGELCLSPVGLASMTKLAPERVASLMMGVWFLAASVGNYLGGAVSGYYEKLDLPLLLGLVAGSAILMAILMFALVKPIARMMARSEEEMGTS